MNLGDKNIVEIIAKVIEEGKTTEKNIIIIEFIIIILSKII